MPNDKMDIDEGSKDKSDLKKAKKFNKAEQKLLTPTPIQKLPKNLQHMIFLSLQRMSIFVMHQIAKK